MFAFDSDTAGVSALSGRWNALAGVNGGYMLAVCVRALGDVMPFPDPLAVSAFFLRPGTVGPADISAEVLRAGKTTAFGQTALSQSGREIVRATAAFSTLGSTGGPEFHGTKAPDLPPPEDCVAPDISMVPEVSIARRVEYRAPTLPGWVTGSPSGTPLGEFWMRFRDGREPDVWSLPLFVDAAPPAVMELGVMSTTLELTVHVRARPAPGWLACRVSTKFLTGGYHEEDFEIWDSAGSLVAQSRQLALVLR
jgi:acyl-CoA thioesterase